MKGNRVLIALLVSTVLLCGAIVYATVADDTDSIIKMRRACYAANAVWVQGTSDTGATVLSCVLGNHP